MAVDGDLALISTDEIVQDMKSDVAFISEGQDMLNLRHKLDGRHVVDKLDYMNDEKEVNEIDKATILTEIVQELKEELPRTYDEAWNHNDPKLREHWRASIKKELRSMIYVR